MISPREGPGVADPMPPPLPVLSVLDLSLVDGGCRWRSRSLVSSLRCSLGGHVAGGGTARPVSSSLWRLFFRWWLPWC